MRKYRLRDSACLASLAFGVSLGWATTAFAADPSDDAPIATDNHKATTVQGVTVTAAPSKVPLTTPYTESVIAPETLQNVSLGPTLTLQTLLNTEPSIFAFTDGPSGVRTTIFLRAFTSGQFSETFDGVALNDVFNASVTGGAENVNNVLLTPNDVDGVQLYRGINNPAVNSYNSLGGTINFTSRKPSDTFGAEAGVSYGSFDTIAWRAGLDTGDIDGWKQHLSLSKVNSDGWLDGTRDANANLFYSSSYTVNPDNLITGVFTYNTNHGDVPYNVPLPLIQEFGRDYQFPRDWENHQINNDNWLAILGWKSQLASNVVLENKVFGGWDEYLRTSFSNPAFQQSASQPYSLEDSPEGFPFWLFSSNYTQGPTYNPAAVFGSSYAGTDYHFYGYTAWGVGDNVDTVISLPNNTVTFGGNVSFGALHSREYWYGSSDMPHTEGYNDAWDEFDHRTLASVYAQDEISLFDDRLHVTPGLKYIYARTDDHDSVGFYYPLAGYSSGTQHFLSPTIGVNYKATDNISVYGAFGRNVKFPDISAYYGAFQTDVNGNNVIVPVHLKPEFVNDYELGARYQLDHFSAELNLYREDFQNTFFSEFDSTSGLSTTLNGGASRYQGVEVQFRNDFGRVLWGNLDGFLNYSHNEANFTTGFSEYGGVVTPGTPIADVPQDLVSAGVVWRSNGWRFNLNGRYVGKQFMNQYNAGTSSGQTISPYFLVDVGLSDTVEMHGFDRPVSAKFALNVDNLFNKTYLNEAFTDVDYFGNNFTRGVMGAPRSITASITLKY